MTRARPDFGGRTRAGFTLVELLVALVIGVGLTASMLVFFQTQVRVFALGSERANLLQGSQAASSTLMRDLRTAGTNVVAQQPWLVYAGADAIAFHADYASSVVDAFAVYVDPDAPVGQTRSLTQDDRQTLPATSFAYPDTTYWAMAGVTSPAELLIFFFAPDSSTARTDDYVLRRQVNAAASETVARGLLRADTLPFFEYYALVSKPDSAPVLAVVPTSEMPLRHSARLHLSAADTGAVARVDSVRAVRFNFSTTNGREGDAEQRITRRRTVWFRNGGLATQRTCGSSPLFGEVPTATIVLVDETPTVRLEWGAAADETGGEEDVVRYVVWRHLLGAPPGDPYISIPAGGAPYSFTDSDVMPGDAWVYTIAAQDCTPSLSSTTGVGPIIVP
ncbi:MAG: prepilin-type N-terminal cleavage/methylation domain-containing protein [Gemmatimonadota bacterium]